MFFSNWKIIKRQLLKQKETLRTQGPNHGDAQRLSQHLCGRSVASSCYSLFTAVPRVWGLSSLTRDWARAPCSRIVASWPLDHQRIPRIHLQELQCTSTDHVVGCFSGKRHHKQNHISRGRHSFELPARSLSWDPSSPWRSLAFLGEACSADATVASQMLWSVYSPGCQ